MDLGASQLYLTREMVIVVAKSISLLRKPSDPTSQILDLCSLLRDLALQACDLLGMVPTHIAAGGTEAGDLRVETLEFLTLILVKAFQLAQFVSLLKQRSRDLGPLTLGRVAGRRSCSEIRDEPDRASRESPVQATEFFRCGAGRSGQIGWIQIRAVTRSASIRALARQLSVGAGHGEHWRASGQKSKVPAVMPLCGNNYAQEAIVEKRIPGKG
ncbi:uncharacterized protein IUM83_16468 [Phytophthora cinnamomi]|uniref:uncharacterized protein n=1 Tax=Phytophthora cinnamomi TaxID=4785 RepID=UPI0035595B89|nr:hypothetical protein IUM83_16468 [Phytophthora cinnamomi]